MHALLLTVNARHLLIDGHEGGCRQQSSELLSKKAAMSMSLRSLLATVQIPPGEREV